MLRSISGLLLAFVLTACGDRHPGDEEISSGGSVPGDPPTPSTPPPPTNSSVPSGSVRWERAFSDPVDSHFATVALNPNGLTGLLIRTDFAPDEGVAGKPPSTFELRAYDLDGDVVWVNRSFEKRVEPDAWRDGWMSRLESWSSSFVLLSNVPFSDACASKQDPEGAIDHRTKRARFFDETGSCIRDLGMGPFTMAFAADPAGNVWYQFRTMAMSPRCFPPRIVNRDGAFVFHGEIDNAFDPHAMLQWPIKRFGDGRIFAARQGEGCREGDGAIGILANDYLPAWTVKAVGDGPFDVGGGDFATVAEHPAAVTFGATTVGTGGGFVVFRYASDGTPKFALRIAPPFDGPRFLHADEKGFIVASPPTNANQQERVVAAIGWDGALQWQSTIPCSPWMSFAADPEHGLRLACSMQVEGERRWYAQVIAIER